MRLLTHSPSQTTLAEQCWVLVGRRQGRCWHAYRVCATFGTPERVAFDAGWVLEREESRGDVVGFYHTHPNGSTDPSQRDRTTMLAWCECFGKPLLCVIESEGQLTAFCYSGDEPNAVPVAACELLPYGRVVAADGVGGTSYGQQVSS